MRENFTREHPFNPTGHYPVLAGFDPSGKALYVAHDSDFPPGPNFFTCEESIVQAEDSKSYPFSSEPNGKPFGTGKVYVLSLQHDPSDIQPPYPNTPQGAMDPTGPLHWLRFWPNKDPEFPNEFNTIHGLHHLEKFLDIMSRPTKPTDTDQDHISELRDAICVVDPKKGIYRAFWRRCDRADTGTLSEESDDDYGDGTVSTLRDPESEWGGESEDSDEDSDDASAGQLSPPSLIRCSTPNSRLAHATDLDATGEVEFTTFKGELGVLAENGGSEVHKLKEELRRTREELRRTQGLVAKLQDEKNASSTGSYRPESRA